MFAPRLCVVYLLGISAAEFGSKEGAATQLERLELPPPPPPPPPLPPPLITPAFAHSGAVVTSSTLSQIVAIVGAVRNDRIYLMERYAYFFHSIVYHVTKDKLAECLSLGVTCVACENYNCKSHNPACLVLCAALCMTRADCRWTASVRGENNRRPDESCVAFGRARPERLLLSIGRSRPFKTEPVGLAVHSTKRKRWY
jgi:hypothetical protein